jgi:hypothetical protein
MFISNVTGKEITLNTQSNDFLSEAFTMYIFSMLMASILVVPTIIGTAHTTAMWRLLDKR